MNRNTYYKTASTIFAIVSVAHLLRALYGWDAVVGGAEVPLWFSWAAFLLAGYLALRGFDFIKKPSRR